jgi:hypothetical protein
MVSCLALPQTPHSQICFKGVVQDALGWLLAAVAARGEPTRDHIPLIIAAVVDGYDSIVAIASQRIMRIASRHNVAVSVPAPSLSDRTVTAIYQD